MTGSTDDSRPGWDGAGGRAGQCPGCGRSTADDVCLHCAAEDHFRSASLVRGFVAFPGRDPGQPASGPPAASGLGDRVRGQPGGGVSGPSFVRTPPRPAPARSAAGTRTRRRNECGGRGPRKILLSVAIALGAILLAALVGIVGAVMTGPVSGPGVDATPTADRPG
ncbi:hypothetical protein GKC29_29260 [Micromonospora sp. WMMC415]|uniref:hypothetical protein n=1 Tax=Micromonospora sp. WMMC415 TaxID=2675222 RepID=UPI0012B4D707|nr:hypothetical protein [Micromonospora sp. WMMC415]QGN50511.1 hypothetical protein GKC29_29260 [Micromonospora sp. WMMC415]